MLLLFSGITKYCTCFACALKLYLWQLCVGYRILSFSYSVPVVHPHKPVVGPRRENKLWQGMAFQEIERFC